MLSGWLYWQNVRLTEVNKGLHHDLAAANKTLAKLHHRVPKLKGDSALMPAESAQKHLAMAQDAVQRKDYATAIHQLDLADQDAKTATSDVSEKSREAGKTVQAQLDALRTKVTEVAGQWLHPKHAKPTDAT